MALDDAETIRRFISQIKGQHQHSISSSTLLTSPPTTQHPHPHQHKHDHDHLANRHDPTVNAADTKHMSEYEYNKSEVQGAKTPPHLTVTRQDHDQDQDHLTSPEPHPKPSPHISGLTAPNNTPKTAASSPRLAASNTHNEDVSEAFSDYVNSMDGRPLSDSIWAPGSARYKPSVLSGSRSTRLLTPIKPVELIPSINDTFDRMSFKAADPDHRVDENLIGDRVTHSIFSKAPPSFVNKFSVLADRLHGDEVDNVQAKSKAASDEHFEPSTHTDMIKNVQFKTDGAGKEDSKIALNTDKSEEVQAKADRVSGMTCQTLLKLTGSRKRSTCRQHLRLTYHLIYGVPVHRLLSQN